MLRFLILGMFFFGSSGFAEEISSRSEGEMLESANIGKIAETGTAATLFGRFETRHHLNTYYASDGYVEKRSPALHARFVLGWQPRPDLALFLTLGALKETQTQMYRARRTEVEIDYTAANLGSAELLLYGIIKTPFSGQSDNKIDDMPARQGSIVSLGFMGHVDETWALSPMMVSNWLGVNYWTDMYSREQPVVEENADQYSLVKNENGETEIADKQEIHSEYNAGFGIKSSLVPDLSVNTDVFYQINYVPKTTDENLSISEQYKSERLAFYRIRMAMRFSNRSSIMNDFYHYHGGFFEGKQVNSERRFRNVARFIVRF